MIAHELGAPLARPHLEVVRLVRADRRCRWRSLIALATRRRGGMYEPRAVPLALLVVVVLQIAVTPGPERGHPPLRGGGRLGRARDDPRSRGRSATSSATCARRASPTRTRRRGRSCCSAPIRPIDAADRDGRGLAGAQRGRSRGRVAPARTSTAHEGGSDGKLPRHPPAPASCSRAPTTRSASTSSIRSACRAGRSSSSGCSRSRTSSSSTCSASSSSVLVFIAFFAILFTKKWPRGLFDFARPDPALDGERRRLRVPAAARRVPAVLR